MIVCLRTSNYQLAAPDSSIPSITIGKSGPSWAYLTCRARHRGAPRETILSLPGDRTRLRKRRELQWAEPIRPQSKGTRYKYSYLISRSESPKSSECQTNNEHDNCSCVAHLKKLTTMMGQTKECWSMSVRLLVVGVLLLCWLSILQRCISTIVRKTDRNQSTVGLSLTLHFGGSPPSRHRDLPSWVVRTSHGLVRLCDLYGDH